MIDQSNKLKTLQENKNKIDDLWGDEPIQNSIPLNNSSKQRNINPD